MIEWRGQILPEAGQYVEVIFWNGHRVEGWIFYDMDDKPGIMCAEGIEEISHYDPVAYGWCYVKSWRPIYEVEE